MRSAVKNFLIVTLGTLICVSFAWFYLRQRGLSTAVRPPPQHAFLQALNDDVIAYDQDGAALKKLGAEPNAVLWFDIRPRADGVLVIADSVDHRYAVGETDPRLEKAPTFKDVIASLGPKQRYVLSFTGNRQGLKESILAEVDAVGVGERALIQSPEDGLLKELREARPQWIFGTSAPQLTVLKMLSNFRLEASAALRGDVLVILNKPERKIDWTDVEPLIREGHRRAMKVIAGPADAAGFQKLIALGADGVLTRTPLEVLDRQAAH